MKYIEVLRRPRLIGEAWWRGLPPANKLTSSSSPRIREVQVSELVEGPGISSERFPLYLEGHRAREGAARRPQ